MTPTKSQIQRKTCMIRMQKPLRWLLRRVYRFVHRTTNSDSEKDNASIVDKSKHRGSVHFRNSDEILQKKVFQKSKSTIVADNLSEYSGGDGSDDQRKETLTLLKLPVQVRQSIYNLIDARDILTLRLTCNKLKEDIESSYGVYMRVHDGRLDYEKTLQKLGIAELNVERLVSENLSYTSMFPHPELLKTLIISGSISRKNLEFLLEISFNLTELRLHFTFYDQKISIENYLISHPLINLQTFHVICNTTSEISESPSVLESIRSFLNDMSCPNLSVFRFHVDGLVSNRMREYHNHSYRFITRNDTLKKIDVQLRQLGSTATNRQREDILLVNEMNETVSKLRVLQLNINKNSHLWYPLLDSQTRLRSLNLQLCGQNWNRLILTLDKNARSLMYLRVAGICSTSQDGITTLPVDFGILRNLRRLETLEIQHINMESRGVESPIVLRTSSLAQLSLKTVKLVNLRLKSHQAMFLLVKLPMLETLDLECWCDTEGSLAGYLSVVTFLIKFDLTPVESIVLTDSRRRMENQQYEINKMIKTLPDVANIRQTNTELYSTLCISRYI